jgi:hypothetical protein
MKKMKYRLINVIALVFTLFMGIFPWSRVTQAETIFQFVGPLTGDPIAITTYPDSDLLDLTNTNFTVSACVLQIRRNPGYSSAIFAKRGTANGWALLLEGEDGGAGRTGIVKFRTSYTLGTSLITSNQSLSLNTTYHVAVVYQAGQAQIFINGIDDGNKALLPPKASEKPLRLGGDYDYGTNNDQFRWRGTLSNLRIDNVALSQAEIQGLSANCSDTTSTPPDTSPCEPNNPFVPCIPPPIGGGIKTTYNPSTGELYIPQLSISGTPQTCEAYLSQVPSTLDFRVDINRLNCR